MAPPAAQPSPDGDGSITVSAYPVREVVDPLDQNRDIHNVLDYLLDHPRINPKRVGLWGSSFGGGHVIFVAGNDPRIRDVVSQVPGMGGLPDSDGPPTVPAEGQPLGSTMAKGELWAAPRSPEMPESLRGAGDSRTMWRYLPRVAAQTISVPTLILDQEDEEYGGRENSGMAAHKALPPTTTSRYHVFQGGHYDIYEKNYREASTMARDWFLEHL